MPSYVVFHISDHWIEGIWVKRRRKKQEIIQNEKTSIKSSGGNNNELSSQTKEWMIQFLSNLPHKRVKIFLTFSHSTIVTREIEIPKVAKKQMHQMLKIHLKEELPKEASQYLIHYKKIYKKEEKDINLSLWLITASPYFLVMPYLFLIEDRGFKVEKIDYIGYGLQRSLLEKQREIGFLDSYVMVVHKRSYSMDIYLYDQGVFSFSRHHIYQCQKDQQWIWDMEYFLNFFNHRISKDALSVIAICEDQYQWGQLQIHVLEKNKDRIKAYKKEEKLDFHTKVETYKTKMTWIALGKSADNRLGMPTYFSQSKSYYWKLISVIFFLTFLSFTLYYGLFYEKEKIEGKVMNFTIEEEVYHEFLLAKQVGDYQNKIIEYIELRNPYPYFFFEILEWVLQEKDIQIISLVYTGEQWDIQGQSAGYPSIISFIELLEEQEGVVFLHNIWKNENDIKGTESYRFKLSLIQMEEKKNEKAIQSKGI